MRLNELGKDAEDRTQDEMDGLEYALEGFTGGEISFHRDEDGTWIARCEASLTLVVNCPPGDVSAAVSERLMEIAAAAGMVS